MECVEGDTNDDTIGGIAEQLAATDLLADLPSEAIRDLADRVDVRPLAPGTVLCREGDEGDSAHLVVSGRLQADAGGRAVGEIGRGELVGEVSLLTGKPRSATVTALRDSTVLTLGADVFAEMLSRHEHCYRSVSRQLVERLQRVLSTTSGSSRAALIAVVSDGRPVSIQVVTQLIDRLGPDVAVAQTTDVDLAGLEEHNDVVVLAPPVDDPDACRWALRQCDRAVQVVDARHRQHQQALVGRPPGPGERAPDVVLVHPATTSCPSGTRRWLDTLRPADHHHVRQGNTGDLDRVVRRLTGRERVLVLSGGGARGLAHGGLWRALTERQIGIDAVVGASSGAVAAAIIAMGHDADTGAELAMRLFGDGRSPVDLTVPTVSVASGARLTAGLRELCGEARTIEDLWMRLSVVSTNLTTSDANVHRTGSLWRALRASTAIPGVFPPAVEPEGVLVDGGVVDNLPIALARRLHPGAVIIAGDVGRKMELSPGDFAPAAESGGWRDVRSRLGRGRTAPGMIRILAHVSALGGVASNQEPADVHIEFDLDRFGIFDFRKGREISATGYAQAAAELDAALAEIPHLSDRELVA